MTKTIKGNHAKIETTQTYLKETQTKGKHSRIETTQMYIEKA